MYENHPYDIDAEIDKLLTVESFRANNFTLAVFIETLSKSCSIENQESAQNFNPKPYIRVFEATLDRLVAMNSEILKNIKDNEVQAKKADVDHSLRVKKIKEKFDNLVKEFNILENKVNASGKFAIEIGKQFEQIDKENSKAQEGKLLIQSYVEIVKGNFGSLEELRLANTIESQALCASLTRNLHVLTKDINLSGSSKTIEALEKFSEVLEKDLLQHFDRAYRAGNLEHMAKYAKILFDFNGGGSVVRNFVNQHDFFIAPKNLENYDINKDDKIWKKLSDPDVNISESDLLIESNLQSLINLVRKTVKTEYKIIRNVFPNSSAVFQVFLQRIFAQSIQLRLEEIIGYAELNSTLAYLRVLQATHSSLTNLVEDLKSFEQMFMSSDLTNESSSLASYVLEQCLNDLFVPYLEGSRYIEKEKKSLDELYSSFLCNFNAYHTQKRAMKNSTVLDRVVSRFQAATISSQSTSASGRDAEGSSGTEQGSVQMLFRLAGLEKSNTNKDRKEKGESRSDELEIHESDGKVSFECVNRILKWNAETIGRVVELFPQSELAKDSFSILKVLFEYIFSNYLNISLETIFDTIDSYDGKSEPELKYFDELKQMTIIIHLFSTYLNTIVLPVVSFSLTLRRDILISANNSISEVENKINLIIEKSVEIILNWVSVLLGKQKKNDFKPKDDDKRMENLSTEPCKSIVQFISKVYNIVSDNLMESNLENFLVIFGTSFLKALLEHFKKFFVSPSGGLILTKDLTEYEKCIKSWGIPKLNEKFKLLHELGNIFIVRPDILRSLLNEGMLARINLKYLIPYISKRTDYYTTDINKIILNEEIHD
ncbi:exocyst subunit SEC10 [Pneumocystis jirovecii RU7]|uniref:Uncharacterized protein n=1 Tax=Pneumocystis jirovecii (strain RU7) TaxID=1408657 RepID=A0A0W4ZDX1_PNEJ7|nr:exocyst subunit SEC10 [Pneumocystis jirovecii RU7]KTW26572.1 hypothetical protein T551_03489 [Pneumocystis jirovecii RU7]